MNPWISLNPIKSIEIKLSRFYFRSYTLTNDSRIGTILIIMLVDETLVDAILTIFWNSPQCTVPTRTSNNNNNNLP